MPSVRGACSQCTRTHCRSCCHIKWLNEIKLVGDSEPATAQMLEFASRTHQQGKPTLAKDYIPATIDHVGMPIRVEQWRVAGKTLYKVVGIAWGGARPTTKMRIRFRDGEAYQPLTICPAQRQNSSWTLWEHRAPH